MSLANSNVTMVQHGNKKMELISLNIPRALTFRLLLQDAIDHFLPCVIGIRIQNAMPVGMYPDDLLVGGFDMLIKPLWAVGSYHRIIIGLHDRNRAMYDGGLVEKMLDHLL